MWADNCRASLLSATEQSAHSDARQAFGASRDTTGNELSPHQEHFPSQLTMCPTGRP